MNKSLLKNLTYSDVQEILDAGELLWNDYIEPTAENILRRLRNENNIPPPIEETFQKVLNAAEQATSWLLTDSRERENSLIRSFVAYKLHNDGYSFSEIGKMLKRDHSTVAHLVYRMRDMLSVPGAYKWELQQHKRFEEFLCG